MYLFYYHIQKLLTRGTIPGQPFFEHFDYSTTPGFYFKISFCCAIVQKNKPMFSGVDFLIFICWASECEDSNLFFKILSH